MHRNFKSKGRPGNLISGFAVGDRIALLVAENFN